MRRNFRQQSQDTDLNARDHSFAVKSPKLHDPRKLSIISNNAGVDDDEADFNDYTKNFNTALLQKTSQQNSESVVSPKGLQKRLRTQMPTPKRSSNKNKEDEDS